MNELTFTLTHYVDQGRPIVELVEPVIVAGFTIPAGFKTDFASIPRAIAWAFPIFGRSCKAAILHDYLCYTNYDKRSRSKIFYKQMLEDNVPKAQAWLQYVAVRYWPGNETIQYEK